MQKQTAESTCSSLTITVLKTSSLSTSIGVCIVQANRLLLQLELLDSTAWYGCVCMSACMHTAVFDEAQLPLVMI